MVKNLSAMQETWVQSWDQEDPLEKRMVTHSSILAWKSHGKRDLVGYSLGGHKELDTTERLSTAHSIYDQLAVGFEVLPKVTNSINTPY